MKKISQRDFMTLYGLPLCRNYFKLAYLDFINDAHSKNLDDFNFKKIHYVIFMSEYKVDLDRELYKISGVSVMSPSGKRGGDGDPNTLLAATEQEIESVLGNQWEIDTEHDYDVEIDEIMAGTFSPSDIGYGTAVVDESGESNYSNCYFTFLLYIEHEN